VVGVVLCATILTSCGSSGAHKPNTADTASIRDAAAAHAVVAQVVGATPITGASYDHWLAVGEATVEMPKRTGPLPKPVHYEPPFFTACIVHLRPTAAGASTSELRSKCRKTYEGIQERILNFLITGYWLRREASEHRVTVSPAEVRKRFEEVRHAHYTTASFRRLREASRQTVADLEFAVETQMLSAKLLEVFTKAHPHERSEQATIAAFNKSIRRTWMPQTSCEPGYVVADCKQYKP
jgi:hypothetical protein